MVSVSNGSADIKGQSISHVSGGHQFIWDFSCGGGDCYLGQFIGGDYWIAPKQSNEKIILHSVSPLGLEHGLEVNPSSSTKQGFLSCQTNSFDNTLNLMNILPVEVMPNSSLVKSYKSINKCGTKSILGCCVDSYNVLTVLAVVPEDNGKSAFRPGFAGNEKKIFYEHDFDFSKIPSAYKLNKSKYRVNYHEIHTRWHSPYVDHFMSGIGDRGRAFSPHAMMSDYGATQAAIYLNDLLAIMSNDRLSRKMPAITGLLQRGIDLYSSRKVGMYWPSGAGQTMGRKPPIVFFASLVRSEDIKTDVMKMTLNNNNYTQEDGQIRIVSNSNGGGNVAIWGDVTGWCQPDFYWSQVFASKNYSGATEPINPKGDSKKSCGDPHGWIDGPAGKPGSFYMSCCTTGGFIAYVVAQNLMPELCGISNDYELLSYVHRVLDYGIHTSPDQCAPPDPRELPSCRPYKKDSKCKYYGKTWGPNPKEQGQCIINGTNGLEQNGRFPHLHATPLGRILQEPNISKFLRDSIGSQLFDNCQQTNSSVHLKDNIR